MLKNWNWEMLRKDKCIDCIGNYERMFVDFSIWIGNRIKMELEVAGKDLKTFAKLCTQSEGRSVCSRTVRCMQ